VGVSSTLGGRQPVHPFFHSADGQFPVTWIQAISKVAFIIFMIFGGIVVIAGLVGVFNNEQFLSSACSGANTATKLTLSLLGGAGRAL
jgi:hypothetical protein